MRSLFTSFGVKKFCEKAIILIYVGYDYTLLCRSIVNLSASPWEDKFGVKSSYAESNDGTS